MYLSLFLLSFHHVFNLILVLCECGRNSVLLYLLLPVWGSNHQVSCLSCFSIDNIKSQHFGVWVIQHHSPETHTSPGMLPWILTTTLCCKDPSQYTKAQPTVYLPSTLSSCYLLFLYLDNTLYLPTWLIFLKCLSIKVKVLWSLEMSGTVYPVTW